MLFDFEHHDSALCCGLTLNTMMEVSVHFSGPPSVLAETSASPKCQEVLGVEKRRGERRMMCVPHLRGKTLLLEGTQEIQVEWPASYRAEQDGQQQVHLE